MLTVDRREKSDAGSDAMQLLLVPLMMQRSPFDAAN